MSGDGKVTVNGETAPIRKDDAVPLNFNDNKSFENTGTAPLELMAIGVVKDLNRKMDIVGANTYGGRGRGAAAVPARGAQ